MDFFSLKISLDLYKGQRIIQRDNFIKNLLSGLNMLGSVVFCPEFKEGTQLKIALMLRLKPPLIKFDDVI